MSAAVLFFTATPIATTTVAAIPSVATIATTSVCTTGIFVTVLSIIRLFGHCKTPPKFHDFIN